MPTFFNTPPSDTTPPTEPHDPASAEAPVEVPAEATIEATTPTDDSSPALTPPLVSPAPTAFLTTPADDVMIGRFREAARTAVGKLNADLGVQLDETRFLWMQTYCRTVLQREPTVGEVRLLDALAQAGRHAGDRTAVGELYTDSPTLATTWADMMHAHRALYDALDTRGDAHKTPTPPCTFTEALTLSERYRRRTHATSRADTANRPSHYVLLTTSGQVAEVAAAGYTAVARVAIGADMTCTVCTRPDRQLNGAPERAGDFLLLLRQVEMATMAALVREEQAKKRPDIAAARAVTDRSILMTVMELCTAADLYANRIAASEGRLPVHALCARPTLSPDATAADFVLRVPIKRVYALTATLYRRGITAIVIGQVRANGRTVLHMHNATGTSDVPIVDLPSSCLREAAAPHLYRRQVTAEDAPGAVVPPATVARPAVIRLPETEGGTVAAAQDTPTAEAAPPNEATPPTERMPSPASLRFIPEEALYVSAATVTVTAPGQGYTAALDTVEAALAPLLIADCANDTLVLTARLTADRDTVDGAPGNRSQELLCGLYRAARESGYTVTEPVLSVATADAEARVASLTVVAAARPRESAVESQR